MSPIYHFDVTILWLCETENSFNIGYLNVTQIPILSMFETHHTLTPCLIRQNLLVFPMYWSNFFLTILILFFCTEVDFNQIFKLMLSVYFILFCSVINPIYMNSVWYIFNGALHYQNPGWYRPRITDHVVLPFLLIFKQLSNIFIPNVAYAGDKLFFYHIDYI